MNSIEKYFNVTSAYNAHALPNKEFVFSSDESGVYQIYKCKIGGSPTQLTFFNERIFRLATIGNDIFFTMDTGGNEQEQIYMLKNGETEAVNLTNDNSARYSFGGVYENTLYFSSNKRNPANYDICKMDLSTKTQEILVQNEDNYNIPASLSPNGTYLLYNKMKGISDNFLYMVNTGTKEVIKIDEDGEYASYSSPVWTKDEKGFFLTTDVNADFSYLAYYDVATKKLEKIYEENWDIEGLSLSYDGKYLAIDINRGGYSEIAIFNTKTGRFENIPKPPKSVISYYRMEWSQDDYTLYFSATNGSRPIDVWALDLSTSNIQKLTNSKMSDIDLDTLVEPTLHHFNSFDGLEVPFWYYNSSNDIKPVVIEVHGGPEGQERPSFSPLTQYLVNEGFAVVGPNIRGSSGYGKIYTHLDDVEKRLDSVKDVKALVEYLIANGFAHKDKIAVMGASYGGYMTLACLTEYPELWSAGIDTVGMSNLETFLENTAKYRRSHRESEYGSLEHHRDVLRAVSPIHKVDKIVAPLMVIHGANDPRVPVSEAEQIVDELRSRDVSVEYLRYEDEGHGLAKLKNKLDCYPKVAEFLKKYLGV